MIVMQQIFDVRANENARYKRNELECWFKQYLFENCIYAIEQQNINKIEKQFKKGNFRLTNGIEYFINVHARLR